MSTLTPNTPTEGGHGIFVIRSSDNVRNWNNIRYKTGMSRQNVGATKLSMNVATVPPGGVAYAHIHVGFELMLYIMQGRVRHIYGPGLTNSIDNAAGDFIYIAAGVPHEVYNLSNTEPVIAVVARSDADEWQNIVNYDPKADLQAEPQPDPTSDPSADPKSVVDSEVDRLPNA
ncbi:MAG: cupin domain-containing protein [Gemmatimonadaceae bacterium]|nr:cupin domain-containing protein [Gemmatimonadaceae bacterium]